MKILHLIYDHIHNPWVGGGGAVRAYELYKRLSLRHDVTMVCGRYPGAQDYSEGNLKVRFAGSYKNNYVLSTFSYAAAAMGFLRRHSTDADIAIEDFAPYNPVFSFMWNRNSILQLHQNEGFKHIKKYFILGLPFMFIESQYHKLFRNIVVESDFNRIKFGVEGNIAVIPNGFNLELFSGTSSESDYFLFLGRLHINQKGLDILRDAFDLFAGEEKLVIAGGGKDNMLVRKLFSSQIHTGAVEMTGFVKGETKFDLLRNCKIFIMPSRYEGQPLTLIEAAACGKPLIISDIPELQYAVDAGFGISFKTGDVKDLAQKIKLLTENEPLRREMGQKAREYAKDYTWDKISLDYERFLLNIIKAR